MWHRRVCYAAALLGALAFQIFNTSYLAHFVLGLALCLPVLGLVVSLPTMARCRVRITGGEVLRGEPAAFRVEVVGRPALPLARLTLRLQLENTLTGERRQRRLLLQGVSGGSVQLLPADTTHCGRLVCGGRRARVCDCLGLFSLWRPVLPGALLVLPHGQPEPLPPAAEPAQQTGPTPCPRAGRRGEDYELRPYRPGDPLRLVHWKLSAKQQDDLVVREMLEDRIPTAVLLVELRGSAHRLDRTLDRLDGLCRTLLARERICHVVWQQPSGAAQSRLVDNHQQLRSCLSALVSTPATTPQIPPLPASYLPAGVTGAVQFLSITESEEGVPWQESDADGEASGLDSMR